MDGYVTGALIRRLREQRGLTQNELAELLFVSDKAVSKWETGRGLPDVTLLEPLARALGVSGGELLSGAAVTNANRAGNMLRSLFYLCPICGNVIHSLGQAAVSCCGVQLPPLLPESPDAEHPLLVSEVEDELYVSLEHPMTKDHYISFLAAVSDSGCQLVKLYPEGEAACRFRPERVRQLYACCNRHGLYRVSWRRQRPVGRR
ncbi:MAG: helix-turn-helix domain-containing protein [Firmicutes bacterium]|nr:helix-turn-helix domain-containing protein [Bacillota bacterium]